MTKRGHLSESLEEGALESVLVSEVDGAADTGHHPDISHLRQEEELSMVVW